MTEEQTAYPGEMDGREVDRSLTEGIARMGAGEEYKSHHNDYVMETLQQPGIAFRSQMDKTELGASRSTAIAPHTKPRDRRRPIRDTKTVEVMR